MADARLLPMLAGLQNELHRARHDQPIDGRAWIDPEKGTLVRSLMRIHVHTPQRRPSEERMILDVNFAFDSTVDLWVPARMREQHELGTRTLQSGEATYSGYRKFGVQSRILP